MGRGTVPKCQVTEAEVPVPFYHPQEHVLAPAGRTRWRDWHGNAWNPAHQHTSQTPVTVLLGSAASKSGSLGS